MVDSVDGRSGSECDGSIDCRELDCLQGGNLKRLHLGDLNRLHGGDLHGLGSFDRLNCGDLHGLGGLDLGGNDGAGGVSDGGEVSGDGAAKAGPRGRGAKAPGRISCASLSAVGAGAAARAEMTTDATFVGVVVSVSERIASQDQKSA